MKYYHFSSISSTNDYARELLATEPEVFVSADFQWAGRGRNEHIWEGKERENIYCSLGVKLKEPVSIEHAVLFQVVGCLAAKSALIKATGSEIFKIKYPNDVLALCYDGIYRKICGVLSENGFINGLCVHTVIGIGLNVRQTEFSPEVSPIAISLSLLGYDILTEKLTTILSDELRKYINYKPENLFEMWRDELQIEGKTVSLVDESGTWKIEKLMDDGRLFAINTSNGITRMIDNGDSIRY